MIALVDETTRCTGQRQPQQKETIMSSFIALHAGKFALAAALALGVAGSAQAGGISGEITVYHGGGHGGGYGGGYGHGGGYGRGGGWHGDYRPLCHPREAVGKAWRQGLRRPGVERVTRRDIVVSGWFHGHRAVLIFDRHSPRCRIIGSRGI
jgi:hypothetical protein